MYRFPLVARCVLIVACASVLLAQSPSSPRRVFFRITAGPALPSAVSGRLLIFLKPQSGDKEVDADEFSPQNTWIAAREIQDLAPGSSVEIDADEIAFPKPFVDIPAGGNYDVQAVLDVDHSYPYSGRSADDWISAVTPLASWTPGSGDEPVLALVSHPASEPPRTQSQIAAANLHEEDFSSPSLSRFWGHEVKIRSWVLLPPGYSTHTQQRFPAVYWTHGFGGNLRDALAQAIRIGRRMQDGKMPPMIWVFLDESIPQGTHEFADSVNNGPWGHALTAEYLPYLERKYRMDARPSGRLLTGHSSGGWATLQLQVNYPTIFGGTWSTSPDPSDFHDFTGTDLYARGANVYHRPDGSPTPIVRVNGKVVATYEQLAKSEAVLGSYGGQVTSFDWVFSPKSKSGVPEAMFDRKTGAVNPSVAQYWHDHYDLAQLVQANWKQRGKYLTGRIHLIVGTADTFYLDSSAHLFEAVLTRLGAEPHFTYLPDRTHFNLYLEGSDQEALFDKIAAEMYAVARPGAPWK